MNKVDMQGEDRGREHRQTSCTCDTQAPGINDLEEIVIDPEETGGREMDRHEESDERTITQWRQLFLDANRPDELLGFFFDFGLEAELLAVALGQVSARSVKRWLHYGLPTTQPANTWRRLDDLRAIIGHLLADGTYDRIGIVAWLCSRQPELSYERPIDALGRGDFDAVLAAAEQMTRPVRAFNPALRHPTASRRLQPVSADRPRRGSRASSSQTRDDNPAARGTR
jgi:hypothetical protein